MPTALAVRKVVSTKRGVTRAAMAAALPAAEACDTASATADDGCDCEEEEADAGCEEEAGGGACVEEADGGVREEEEEAVGGGARVAGPNAMRSSVHAERPPAGRSQCGGVAKSASSAACSASSAAEKARELKARAPTKRQLTVHWKRKARRKSKARAR